MALAAGRALVEALQELGAPGLRQRAAHEPAQRGQLAARAERLPPVQRVHRAPGAALAAAGAGLQLDELAPGQVFRDPSAARRAVPVHVRSFRACSVRALCAMTSGASRPCSSVLCGTQATSARPPSPWIVQSAVNQGIKAAAAAGVARAAACSHSSRNPESVSQSRKSSSGVSLSARLVGVCRRGDDAARKSQQQPGEQHQAGDVAPGLERRPPVAAQQPGGGAAVGRQAFEPEQDDVERREQDEPEEPPEDADVGSPAEPRELQQLRLREHLDEPDAGDFARGRDGGAGRLMPRAQRRQRSARATTR